MHYVISDIHGNYEKYCELLDCMEREVIRKRYFVCKELYEGKAAELYQWLKEEKHR